MLNLQVVTPDGDDLNSGSAPKFPKIITLLQNEKINDILITGGGIIPEQDMKKLYDLGVGKLFGPGATVKESLEYIQNWIYENKKY